MINQVTLGGYLVSTPAISTSKAGNSWCEFGIDTKDKGRDGEQKDNIVTMTAFKANADLLAPLPGGTYVIVTGKLVSDTFTTDGKTISKLKVIAFSVEPMYFEYPTTDYPAQGAATDEDTDPFQDQ